MTVHRSARTHGPIQGEYKISWGQMQSTPPVERANAVLNRPSAVQNEDGSTA